MSALQEVFSNADARFNLIGAGELVGKHVHALALERLYVDMWVSKNLWKSL